MCRNIKTLFNIEPPATEAEIRSASIQFVRKISGTSKPSQANIASFENAVDNISHQVAKLLDSLSTAAPPKNREVEAEKSTN